MRNETPSLLITKKKREVSLPLCYFIYMYSLNK